MVVDLVADCLLGERCLGPEELGSRWVAPCWRRAPGEARTESERLLDSKTSVVSLQEKRT